MIPYLFEGDIVLTEQQIEELVTTMERELRVKETLVKGIRKVPMSNASDSDGENTRDKRTMASTLIFMSELLMG